jgi:dipeptidase E
MKLFLASQDFGSHADRLREMVGENRKTLVVFNARDYASAEDQLDLRKRKEKLLFENGFPFQELDLRNYFGKEKDLEKFIADYKPDLVDLMGGNEFLLRRALAQSGFDKILRRDIKNEKYVFAGHSAGAIVAGPDLHGYERMDYEKLVVVGYQKKVIWDGLSLTNVRVIPHADSPEYKEVTKTRRELFTKLNYEYVVLNDTDVLVIDGEKKELLK